MHEIYTQVIKIDVYVYEYFCWTVCIYYAPTIYLIFTTFKWPNNERNHYERYASIRFMTWKINLKLINDVKFLFYFKYRNNV
jgi:hypothetical protein